MLSCLKSWDPKRDVAIPGDTEATLQFCINHFLSAYQKAVDTKGVFYVALSGGSTPKAIFNLLTKDPFSSYIDWKKVHLFWSDERSVPPTDQESNFHMAMEAGFSKVPIPPEQIHRMQAEKNIEESALSYENLLRSLFKNSGFDYVMLGMGDDGHTASLFPETKGLTVQNRWVIANYIPQKNTFRMTLTFDCINRSSHIVLYVLGKNKKEKVKEVFSLKDLAYPVQQIGNEEHKALWIMDEEAGEFLLQEASKY